MFADGIDVDSPSFALEGVVARQVEGAGGAEIPPPAPAALLLGGLAAMGAVRRARR